MLQQVILIFCVYWEQNSVYVSSLRWRWLSVFLCWFEHLKAIFFFSIFDQRYLFFPWLALAEVFKGQHTMFLTFLDSV